MTELIETRISRESARLISSLDADSRYIKFVKCSASSYEAIICSQVSDSELSHIFSGNNKYWIFQDCSKAVRSIRRLNKTVQIYQGSFSS